jgi:tetratricopeptide (TPR) repeat protein
MNSTPKAIFNIHALRDAYKPLARDGDYKAAEKHLEAALKEHGNLATVHFEVGTFYDKRVHALAEGMGTASYTNPDPKITAMRKKAFRHFAKASDMEPKRYLTAFRAGATARRLLDAKKMKKYILRAYDIESDNSHVWTQIGEYYEMTGRPKEAIGCYNNAMSYWRDFRRADIDVYALAQLIRLGQNPDPNWRPDHSLAEAIRRDRTRTDEAVVTPHNRFGS